MTAYCPSCGTLATITNRHIIRPLGDEAPGAATYACLLSCGDSVSVVMMEGV